MKTKCFPFYEYFEEKWKENFNIVNYIKLLIFKKLKIYILELKKNFLYKIENVNNSDDGGSGDKESNNGVNYDSNNTRGDVVVVMVVVSASS